MKEMKLLNNFLNFFCKYIKKDWKKKWEEVNLFLIGTDLLHCSLLKVSLNRGGSCINSPYG